MAHLATAIRLARGHHIDVFCGRYGPYATNPNLDGTCAFTPDGSVSVYDTNAAGPIMGNPLTVLTTAGSFHGEDSGVEQQLGIEMRLSAVQLRETRGLSRTSLRSWSILMWTCPKTSALRSRYLCQPVLSHLFAPCPAIAGSTTSCAAQSSVASQDGSHK